MCREYSRVRRLQGACGARHIRRTAVQRLPDSPKIGPARDPTGKAKVPPGMPRKPLMLAAIIVSLHLLEAATLATSTTGSLLANLLELLAWGFASVMAFGATRPGRAMGAAVRARG